MPLSCDAVENNWGQSIRHSHKCRKAAYAIGVRAFDIRLSIQGCQSVPYIGMIWPPWMCQALGRSEQLWLGADWRLFSVETRATCAVEVGREPPFACYDGLKVGSGLENVSYLHTGLLYFQRYSYSKT